MPARITIVLDSCSAELVSTLAAAAAGPLNAAPAPLWDHGSMIAAGRSGCAWRAATPPIDTRHAAPMLRALADQLDANPNLTASYAGEMPR